MAHPLKFVIDASYPLNKFPVLMLVLTAKVEVSSSLVSVYVWLDLDGSGHL